MMKVHLHAAVTALLLLATSASVFATTATQRQMFSDVNEDIEPAVVVQNRSGVIYTTTVFMKFYNMISTVNSGFSYSSYNSLGQTRANPLTTPAGYARVADPMLAANTTTSRAPGRIWLSGVAVTSTGGTNLAVWSSDDGGFTWSAPQIITTGDPSVDKPAIAVSEDPSSAGYVYIAYVNTGANGRGPNTIQLMVSPDAGVSWQGPYAVSVDAQSAYQAPQVNIDKATGNVYVLWTQAGPTGSLRLASAGRWTASWTPIPGARNFTDRATLGAGPFYGGYYLQTVLVGAATLRNFTIPTAKIDSTHGRLSVVWHELTLGNANYSPSRMASYNLSAGTWSSPVTVNANTTGHSLKPAMDFDASGNYMVTFYYFPAGSSTYEQHARYVDASGNPLAGEVTISTTPFDVNAYSADSTGVKHLGEYQDVKYLSGTWYSVAIGVVVCGDPALQSCGNPYIWSITQP